ncbi:hypothetical protein ACCC92_11290 [Mucilaginibacter sp. Mucisp84]|uniref:hypothetical protein n=1 Tax=Mucilaginibacter sp. Mucisp84 TaxID=3243058 RepID=UPI0039A64109
MDTIVLSFIDELISFNNGLIYRKYELVFLSKEQLLAQFVDSVRPNHDPVEISRLEAAIGKGDFHFDDLLKFAKLGALNEQLQLTAGILAGDGLLAGLDLKDIYGSAVHSQGDPQAYAATLLHGEYSSLRAMVVAGIYIESRKYQQGLPLLFESLVSAWRYPNHYWNTVDSIQSLSIGLNKLLELLPKLPVADVDPSLIDRISKLAFLFTSRAIYLSSNEVVYFFVARANLTEQFGEYLEGMGTGEFEIANLPIADYYKAFNEGEDPSKAIISEHLARLATKNTIVIEDIEAYSWYDNLAIGSFSTFLVSLGVFKAYSDGELYIANEEVDRLLASLLKVYPDDHDRFLRSEEGEATRQARLSLEEKSTFAEKIKTHLQHAPTFYGYYAYCIQEYVNKISRETFTQISRGIAVLSTGDQLMAYFIAYGAMHYYKLADAYQASKAPLSQGLSLSIIDYGCGQALATNILVDFLAKEGINAVVENITLVEPSTIAPARGMVLLNLLLGKNNHNPVVKIVPKLLGGLIAGDITGLEDTLKIHCFSNILDIQDIDLVQLAAYIHGTFKGDNLFVCTSPSYGKTRIDAFYQLVSKDIAILVDIVQPNDIGYRKIYKYTQGAMGQHNVTRYTRVFILRFD